MRNVILTALLAGSLFGQGADDQIQTEFQTMMDLVGQPKEGQQLDEAAAKARADQFKQALDRFLGVWEKRSSELSQGRLVVGRAYALAGRPREAIPHFRAFIAANGTSPDIEHAMISLGTAHLDGRELSPAVQIFEQFLQTRPQSDRRHVVEYYLAMALHQQGDTPRALTLLRSLAERNFEDQLMSDAQVKLIEILRDSGQVVEGRERLSKLMAKHSEAPFLDSLKEQLEWIGRDAPELSSLEWIQGEGTKLASLRGQVVVLNFFADFYEACQTQLDELVGLASKFRGRPVVFLAITKYYRPVEKMPLSEQRNQLTTFIRGRSVTFPVGVAGRDDFSNLKAYGVRGIPQTVVIQKDGKLAHVKYGASRENVRANQDLEQAILRALR